MHRLVGAYIARLGVELHGKVPIFRNRSGRPCLKDTLGDDFLDIRTMVFGPTEARTLAGSASAETISAKTPNTLSTSNDLHKTYLPVKIGKVREADKARIEGRRRRRTNK
jgi:hypothetical protein